MRPSLSLALSVSLTVLMVGACSESSSSSDSGKPDQLAPDLQQGREQPPPDSAARDAPADRPLAEAAAADRATPDLAAADQTPADLARADSSGNLCADLKSLCILTIKGCTSGGGTLQPAGIPGCIFNLKTVGFCCKPPAPAATGSDCQSRGGLCVDHPGICDKALGIMAPQSPGCSYVCCLLPSACPGAQMECCAKTWTSLATCDRGTWTCPSGMTGPFPRGTC